MSTLGCTLVQRLRQSFNLTQKRETGRDQKHYPKVKKAEKKPHKKTTPVHTINVYSGVFFKLMFETVIQHYPKERNSQRPRTLKY